MATKVLESNEIKGFTLHSRVEALIRVSSTPLGSFALICSSSFDSSGNNTYKYHCCLDSDMRIELTEHVSMIGH